MGWKAFDLGYNGWGYYCYYSPRGNPWDIRTWTELGYSYQMVFPGPQGPILMPIYEEIRDGGEDYRLLAALRQGGQEDVVQQLLNGYRYGKPLAEPTHGRLSRGENTALPVAVPLDQSRQWQLRISAELAGPFAGGPCQGDGDYAAIEDTCHAERLRCFGRVGFAVRFVRRGAFPRAVYRVE